MQYYYMDKDEIAIRTSIKDLTAISTTIINNTNKIILSCSTANGHTLTFDNKSRYFPLFLDTLSRVYAEEKEKRNIIIFDNYSEKILSESYHSVYPYNFDNLPTHENQKIYYQKYDINSLLPIIYELLLVTLSISGDKVEGIIKLTGIRDLFTLKLKVNDKEKLIPLKFTKKDDFCYSLILGNVYGPRSLDVSIDFTNEGLVVKWYVAGSDISGILKYEVGESVKEHVDVFSHTQYIFHNEEEQEPLETDKIPKSIKYLYPGYSIYHLNNDLYLAVYINGLKRDIQYISDTEHIRKTRDFYQEEVEIENLRCPILSSKKVIEEYHITDDLTLTQEFFVYLPLEGDYYENDLQNKVLFKIIADGITYYPSVSDNISYLKSLDEKMLRKVIEEMS